MHSSNHIIKFADDTTVVGLISKNDESAYREEVQRLTDWCRTKQPVSELETAPLWRSSRAPSSLEFTWQRISPGPLNTSTITKKAQQRLYFLAKAEEGTSTTAHLPSSPPSTEEPSRSILSSCITAWFGNCTASDRKSPAAGVVRTAEKIIGVSLPHHHGHLHHTLQSAKQPALWMTTHNPSHTLFTLLPSGKSAECSSPDVEMD
ncbi:hypothetical protein NFI96_016476 [Prochilodus magdalenae]|nr:hypothetical protein NFI96_016476 [Prochilodus magdalenae]